MESAEFYMAKVNVNQNIFNAEEEVVSIINEKIPEQILEFTNSYKGKYIPEIAKDGSEVRWTLADITKVNDEIITGNLTKSLPLKYDSLNKENKVIEKSPKDEFRTEKAFFVYFVDIEKVCFKTNRVLNKNIFVEKFKDLLEFEHGYYTIGELEVILITESSTVKNILINHKIAEIKLDIVYPNGKKTFSKLQDIFKSTRTNKAQLNLKNKGGLQVKEENTGELNDVVKEGLGMTEAGYGSMSVRYYDGGKLKTSSTKNSPVKLDVDMPEDGTNVRKSDIIDLQKYLREREKS
jgi:hypothetical protein